MKFGVTKFCLTKLLLACTVTLACLLAPSLAQAQTSAEIAPGVTLPHTGMVALLSTVDGRQSAVPVHGSEIKSNAHAGSNFARGMVYAGPHSTVELDGVTSSLTTTNATPVLFIRLPSEDPDTQRNRATLVRLKPTKDTRVVLDFSANVFGGSRKRHVDEIAVTKSDIEGGWLKITPQKPLEPGQYGITFLPKDPMLFADIVYDFAVIAK